MSTLTKVLIVLLSVFSLFLCGVVVTYVANASNYKEMYDTQRRNAQIARNNQQDAENELAEYKAAAERTKQALEQQLSDLQIGLDNVRAQFDDAQRENAALVQKVANSADTVKVTSATQQKMLEQSQADQARVTALLAEQTRLEKELKETDQLLREKMAIIDQLQAKNNQLVQANQELETRVNQYLQPSGRVVRAPQPVTPTPGAAQPATPPTRQIDLNGRIVSVDVPNALAEISIGAAAGVRENMQFHVTRGDQFICNLEILAVDPDRAVGKLTRVQVVPQAGDVIRTNL